MRYWGPHPLSPASLLHLLGIQLCRFYNSSRIGGLGAAGEWWTGEGGAGQDREAWAGRRVRTGLMS